MAEEVAPGHADKSTQAERLQQIERWMAERRPRSWINAEALKLWNIQERQVRKLITRIHERRAAEAQTQRPYEREDLAATMELIIMKAIEKGDLAEARKATVDLMRFAGYLDQGADDIPRLPAGPGGDKTQVNIGQFVVDMRALSPIERQARLQELYQKRSALGLPTGGIAPPPQKQLDTPPAPKAGEVSVERGRDQASEGGGPRGAAGAREAGVDEEDADLDDPKWFADP